MKFFWTKDEGSYYGRDKLGHLILHFAIVFGLVAIFKMFPPYAWFISVGFGFLYEWIADCNVMHHGASKVDLLANTIGGVLALVAVDLWVL